jgi:hypothetical protein
MPSLAFNLPSALVPRLQSLTSEGIKSTPTPCYVTNTVVITWHPSLSRRGNTAKVSGDSSCTGPVPTRSSYRTDTNLLGLLRSMQLRLSMPHVKDDSRIPESLASLEGKAVKQVPLGHVGPNPYHNDARLAGYQQPLQPQAWNVTSSPPHVPQTTPDEQGIVSGMDGMSLFPQATSTRDWQQSQSFTGLTKGFDPDTQVQTLVQKSRPELVTPPELWKEGIRARQRLIDTQSGDSEKLDPSFSIRPGTFFSVGRVFKVLWAEPAGGNATVITRNTFKNLFGERVHSKVRWFVVIRKGSAESSSLSTGFYTLSRTSRYQTERSFLQHSTKKA